MKTESFCKIFLPKHCILRFKGNIWNEFCYYNNFLFCVKFWSNPYARYKNYWLICCSILLTYFENQWMYLIDDTDSKLWQGHQNRKLYTTIMNMPWYKNRTRSERLYLHVNMAQKISLGRITVAFLQPSFLLLYLCIKKI